MDRMFEEAEAKEMVDKFLSWISPHSRIAKAIRAERDIALYRMANCAEYNAKLQRTVLDLCEQVEELKAQQQDVEVVVILADDVAPDVGVELGLEVALALQEKLNGKAA